MVLPEANGAGCQGARPMRARRAGCRAHPLRSDAVRAEDAPMPVRRCWTAAACSLHCRASECGAVGSSAVGAAVPQPEGIEVAMQHAAVCAWLGARGIKKAAPRRQSQRAECGAGSTIEPIGRHAPCNCPLCSSLRLSPLARIAGIQASPASGGAHGRLTDRLPQRILAEGASQHRYGVLDHAPGGPNQRLNAARRFLALARSTRSAGLPAQHLGRPSSAQ